MNTKGFPFVKTPFSCEKNVNIWIGKQGTGDGGVMVAFVCFSRNY